MPPSLMSKRKKPLSAALSIHNKSDCGGGSGIRTLGGLSPSSVFKTGAFDHSAKPPLGGFLGPLIWKVKTHVDEK